MFALPRPEITWTDERDDSIITPIDDIITIEEEMIATNTFTSVLTFQNIVKVNESNYTCTANNNVTNAINATEQATSSLTVQG